MKDLDSVARALAQSGRRGELEALASSAEGRALEGMVYSTLASLRGGELNIAVITLDMLRASGVTEDDCDDLANLAGQVAGSRVSVTVRELSADPPESKVSLRTDGGVDASRVCARFGGGGHKYAAGCELGTDGEESERRLVAAVEEALKTAGLIH